VKCCFALRKGKGKSSDIFEGPGTSMGNAWLSRGTKKSTHR